MNVSEKIIRTSIDEGQINALAFFYLCKSLWVSSVFLNYTPQRLAKATKVSLNSVKKYIAWLEKQKIGHYMGSTYRPADPLIFIRNGNLYFSRVQPKKHICRFKTKKQYTIHDIKKILYGKLIDARCNAQRNEIKSKIEVKRVITEPRTLKEVRKRNKLLRWGIAEPKVGKQVSLSCRTICDELNIGQDTLLKTIKFLEREKVMKRTKAKRFLLRYSNGRFIQIAKCKFNKAVNLFKADYPYSFLSFYHGNILVCQASNYKFRKTYSVY
jgi:hypothetical protein